MIDIIIPTFDNLDYLIPTIRSIARNTIGLYKIIVVNNGNSNIVDYIKGDVNIIQCKKNLGWMGGINRGLEKSSSEFVLLLNDDILIRPGDYNWLNELADVLRIDKEVAAVGPSSNVVAGWQNFRHLNVPLEIEVKFLIGFCVLMRRSYLNKIGGLDESLPGGDDFDWSIRFRKMGKKLIAKRSVFIYHHGFVTGERVHGCANTPNGWNSIEMTEKTNKAIIRKHGFKEFVDCVRNYWIPAPFKYEYEENCVFNDIAVGKGIDVGCGQNKILGAIGVDLVQRNMNIGEFGGPEDMISHSDIVASGDDLHMFEDEELNYVVARHSLEHFKNPIKALKEWYRVLCIGGGLGISVPDSDKVDTLKLDKTHKHSFNREYLINIVQVAGFKIEKVGITDNQLDLFLIGKK